MRVHPVVILSALTLGLAVILGGIILAIYQNRTQQFQIQTNANRICLTVATQTAYWQHLRDNLRIEINKPSSDLGLITHDQKLLRVLNSVITQSESLECHLIPSPPSR